jgi:hypothetical protein
MKIKMKRDTKSKQIIVKLDARSYDKIMKQAETEHRVPSEFIRHAALYHIENSNNSTYDATLENNIPQEGER